MHFSTIFKLSALLTTAAVQVTAAQFNVTVGGSAGLVFTPNSVNAQPGDTIFFTFQQKNHTVTQSTLDNPCQPAAGGFDSGFMPVSADNTNGPFPAAQFTVRDTQPIWAYCRQSGHCQQGMVFAVNPGNNFATFKGNAMGTGSSSASPPAGTSTPPTSTSTSIASNPSPTSTGTDHRIVVGGTGILAFTPSNVTAQPGDTVTFEFHQKNHTATQSTFASPCSPMMNGFNSGFQPVGTDATTFPTFTVGVNNTTPVWVYCQQSGHCTSGMVFAINAPATGNTFDAFRSKAMGSTGSTSVSNPAPTTTSATGAAGRNHVQSIAGLMVVLFTSFFFLL
jgi:plastocyanin